MFDPVMIYLYEERYGEGAFGRLMRRIIFVSLGGTAAAIALGVNGFI